MSGVLKHELNGMLSGLEILKLNDEIAMEYVKHGLNSNSTFFASISKIKYVTLQQVREKAEKYIRQEETKISRRGNDNKSGSTRDDYNCRRDRGPSKEKTRYSLDSNIIEEETRRK